ncbi:hypothetical protein QBC38DRAFT_439947 [Podospora fimiseda]|uniref:Uncharacterized protein n=1 Tax=Podospora fimiseda TaxID=252190 RepID=A0AAN7BY57_9PEZI|nr:hypothetical protein QBC38DRAFT_439947 [Podospora fimiseda]
MPPSALDSAEAENSFLAAAGLIGPKKPLKNFQKQEFKSTSQPGFLRALAQQKTDGNDKTGIGWGAASSSQSDVQESNLGGWTPNPKATDQGRVEAACKPAHTSPVPRQLNQSIHAPIPIRQQVKQSAPVNDRRVEQGFVREGVKPQHNKPTPRPQDAVTTCAVEMTAPEVEIQAPNLRAIKAPRPNRSWEGSKRSLLLSVSCAAEGSTDGTDDGMVGSRDIRNEIGLPNKLQLAPNGKVWMNTDFAHWAGQEYDPLWDFEYLDPFIVNWMQTVPDTIKPSFIEDGVPNHWDRDVNPATGELIEPISFPETFANEEKLDQELDWRRQNWSSSLMVRRQHNHLENDRKRNRYSKRVVEKDASVNLANINPPLTAPDPEPVAAEPKKPRKPPTVVPPADDGIVYPRWVPRMPCFLRPAERIDMEAVAEIYDIEMKKGLQVRNSEPLTVFNWEDILDKSKELGMPFIVAVRGSVMDLGLNLKDKHSNFILSCFKRVPRDVKDPKGQRSGEILGFGFFTPWQVDLDGNPNGIARGSARMHCYVHPDFRRKAIGYSIMDMLMYCTSSRFTTQQMYDFVDPDNSPVYWRPLRRAEEGNGKGRIFMCIYAGYFFKHKHVPFKDPKLEEKQKDYDKDLQWVHDLFYDKLFMDDKGRFDAVYRTAKAHEGEQHWLDEVLYEHQCQMDCRFHESAAEY